jgi:hypothetical protein
MSEEHRPALILGVLIVLLLVLYGAWHWTSRSASDAPAGPVSPPSPAERPVLGPADGRPGPLGAGPGMMGPGKMKAPGSGGDRRGE